MGHCKYTAVDDFMDKMQVLVLFTVLLCVTNVTLAENLYCRVCQSGSDKSDPCFQPEKKFSSDHLKNCNAEHCFVHYNGSEGSIVRGCTDQLSSGDRAQCQILGPTLKELLVPIGSTASYCWTCGDYVCNRISFHLTDEATSWTVYLCVAGGSVVSLLVVLALGWCIRGRYENKMRSVDFCGPDMYCVKNECRVWDAVDGVRRRRRNRRVERIPTAVSTVSRKDDPVLLRYENFDAM